MLQHSQGSTEAANAIFCAGAWADRLAVAAGADPDPRIVPFRGAYLRLRPERRHLVKALIYPVPDPALPFLGVHLTKSVDGEILIGPTALLAPARDAYSLRRVRGEDVRDTLLWPGSWRMFAHWWRTGLVEMRHAAVRSAFVRAAARYVPELRTAMCCRPSPACAPRHWPATDGWSMTSSSPPPTVPCMCATPPRRPPPPR